MKYGLAVVVLIFGICSFSCSDESIEKVKKPYPEELAAKINRGLVCLQKNNNENFLTWRRLPDDPDTLKYYIWRKQINSRDSLVELIGSTGNNCFLDRDIKDGVEYLYSVIHYNSVPDEFLKVIKKNNTDFEAISFEVGEYKQAHVVTGDLNGDGELEFIIMYSKMENVDPFVNAWMKSNDTYKIAAFTRDGKQLWKVDLGWGIEAGLVYSPIVVWDLDADGKCEIILKTNKSNDPLDYSNEYLSILNGINGQIINETRWLEPSSSEYNSNSRNFIAVGHLDGYNPSIIVGRGIYHKQVVCAYDINLNMLWERYFGSDIEPKFNNQYLKKIYSWFSDDQSRGSHSLPVADVDDNGTEEIFWGEHCITEDGDDLWEVKDHIPYHGHPDIVYPADILPELPGLETYYCREGWRGKSNNIGFLLVDNSGKTIWAKWGLTHVDGGWVDKVIPDVEGVQLFAFDVQKKDWKPGKLTRKDPVQFLLDYKGKMIFDPDTSWIKSFTIDWEGDGIKEIVTRDGIIKRFNGEVIKDLKYKMLWAGDLFGDHREELVCTPSDGKIYIIFNTQEMNSQSEITGLADRRYRNDLSRTAMNFNVIPTRSSYIPMKN